MKISDNLKIIKKIFVFYLVIKSKLKRTSISKNLSSHTDKTLVLIFLMFSCSQSNISNRFILAKNNCSLLSKNLGLWTSPFHSCSILENDCLKCWGPNGFGELGYGDIFTRGDEPGEMGDNLTCIDLGSNDTMNYTAVKLTATLDGNCAILNINCIKCWGANNLGQLGYGDIANRGDAPGEMGNNLPCVNLGSEDGKNYTITDTSTGFVHTCAILNFECVKCWGYGMYGQLGYGDIETRGDEPGEMGNNLSCVNLGLDNKNNYTAKKIITGQFHTCILLNTGCLKCWGASDYGQLGYGNTDNIGDDPGEITPGLPCVNLGSNNGTNYTAIEIAAGPQSTCAILNDGCLKCWGLNSFGQLGYGDTHIRGDEPGEMGNNLTCVDLGSINGIKNRAIQISLGEEHTCVLTDTKCVKCWGLNIDGQLGYGDTYSRGAIPGEMGNNLTCVDLGFNATTNYTPIIVRAGALHTCVILDNGRMKCWGANEYGQLGYGNNAGDNMFIGDQPGELGNNLSFINLGSKACPTSLHHFEASSSFVSSSTHDNIMDENNDYGLIALIAIGVLGFLCCIVFLYYKMRASRYYLMLPNVEHRDPRH